MRAKAVRVGLVESDLEMFAGGHEILLNPGDDDIRKVLARVQKRCRKNLLPLNEAVEVYRRVALDGSHAAHAGLRDCPRGFDFGISTTVAQAARLGEELVGYSIGRIQVLPGQKPTPPVWADPFQDPALWLSQV